MQSLRLTLEYDGTDYSGWQRQPDRRTVEGVLRAALTAVTGEEPALTAAGRTDAGVHSRGQVVGCRLQRAWSPARLVDALNANLPSDVVVRDADETREDFHARYDAVERSYRYVVVARRQKNPLARRYAWTVTEDLDCDAMQSAAQELLGSHDFGRFGKAPDGGSTVRTIASASVRKVASAPGETTIIIEVTANAFLTGMMRGIAGALVAVGRGKVSVAEFSTMLSANQSISLRLAMAPPNGLHQWKVSYS